MAILAATATLLGVGAVGSVYSTFSADFSSDFGGGGFSAVLATAIYQAAWTIHGVASASVPAAIVVAVGSATVAGLGAVATSATHMPTAVVNVGGRGALIGFPGVHSPGRLPLEPDMPPPLKIPSIRRHSAGSAAARTDGIPAIARRAGLHRSAA